MVTFSLLSSSTSLILASATGPGGGALPAPMLQRHHELVSTSTRWSAFQGNPAGRRLTATSSTRFQKTEVQTWSDGRSSGSIGDGLEVCLFRGWSYPHSRSHVLRSCFVSAVAPTPREEPIPSSVVLIPLVRFITCQELSTVKTTFAPVARSVLGFCIASQHPPPSPEDGYHTILSNVTSYTVQDRISRPHKKHSRVGHHTYTHL